MQAIILFLLVGLGVGVVSGILGIGGGVLLIPILMWFFDYTHSKAVGTTLAVMVPPVGLLAAQEYYSRGWVEIWPATLCIAGGFAVGAFFGAKIVPTEPSPLIRLAFGLLLIYIGVRFVVGTSSDVRSTAVAFAVVGVSLVAWLGLSFIGKQYRPVKLADEIRNQHKQPPHEPEYYI